MYSRSIGEVNSNRATSSLLRKRTRLPTHAHEVRALTFEVTDNFGSNVVLPCGAYGPRTLSNNNNKPTNKLTINNNETIRGVRVKVVVLSARPQCWCAGSSLVRGLNFPASSMWHFLGHAVKKVLPIPSFRPHPSLRNSFSHQTKCKALAESIAGPALRVT